MKMIALIKLWLTDPNVFLASILTVIAVGLCFLAAFGIVGEIENHYKNKQKRGKRNDE